MSIPESFPLGVYEYRFCGTADVERVFARDLGEAMVLAANNMEDDAPLHFMRRVGTFDVVTGQSTQEAEQ